MKLEYSINGSVVTLEMGIKPNGILGAGANPDTEDGAWHEIGFKVEFDFKDIVPENFDLKSIPKGIFDKMLAQVKVDYAPTLRSLAEGKSVQEKYIDLERKAAKTYKHIVELEKPRKESKDKRALSLEKYRTAAVETISNAYPNVPVTALIPILQAQDKDAVDKAKVAIANVEEKKLDTKRNK